MASHIVSSVAQVAFFSPGPSSMLPGNDTAPRLDFAPSSWSLVFY